MALPAEGPGGAQSSLLIGAYRTCETLPLIGGLFTRGKIEAQAVLSLIVAAVIDELDLTEIVRERLQSEAIDAVIARIDLVALAGQVIDGVDLPAIIRESMSAVMADAPTEVPPPGFVGRIRGRRQAVRDR